VTVQDRCERAAYSLQQKGALTMYRVKWEIDIEAGSHEEAALKALQIQRDPSSIATVFDVVEAGADGCNRLRHVDLPDDPDHPPGIFLDRPPSRDLGSGHWSVWPRNTPE
jgi:hypothetical protein